MITTLRPCLLAPEVLLLLLNIAVASCAVGGLGLLAVWACRCRPAPLRHGLLLAALVLLIISPLAFWLAAALGGGLDVPLATMRSDPSQATRAGSLAIAGDATSMGGPTDDRGDAAAHGWGWYWAMQLLGTLLAYGWAIGVVVVLARTLAALRLLARLKSTLQGVQDPRLSEAVAEALRLLGIRRHVRLYQAPLAIAPFSWGLLRPRIVLPAGFSTWLDAEQLRCVLLHEAAHIRRGDHWIALLQCCCNACFWWNPLLRTINARLVRLREQICDDHVTATGGDGQRFAEALVCAAEWGASAPAALCSAALLDSCRTDDATCQELEERIVRLVRKKQRRQLRMSRRSRAAVAALAVLVAAALPMAGLRAANRAEASGQPIDAAAAANVSMAADSTSLSSEIPPVLAREWLMRLPAGFTHRVTLRPLGWDRFRLEPTWLNSTGVYEVQGDHLVIVRPDDRRLLGFDWQIHPDGHLTLVGQPPLRETGSNYLGATMVPVRNQALWDRDIQR